MTLRDSSVGPLSFLSGRLLAALQDAGEDGLTVEAQDLLGIPQLGWRLNELRSHGHTIGEEHGTLFLVHDAASTEPSASGDRPETRDVGLPRPEHQAGADGSVDAAPRLFDPVSMGPGAAVNLWEAA